jgi:hypothetical protein
MVDDPVALAKPMNLTITWVRVKDLNRMEENEQECHPGEDRNPIVNGRVMTLIKPAPATPSEPSKYIETISVLRGSWSRGLRQRFR